MAFYITNNGDTDTILTDGGSVKVGENLEVVDGYLNASGGGGGDGHLDNIEVNSKEGTVENKIAKVTIDGSDIITGPNYAESEEVNEDLEIETTDTIDESLGKLQKALKDDEAAVTRAFLAVKDSSGFNENLEYVPEVSPSILANATDLKHADNILRQHVDELETAINTIRNSTLTFTKGVQGTFNTLTTGSKTVSIPWGGNTTNIMKDYPPTNGNYYSDLSTLLHAPEILPLLQGGDLFPGRCITFATGPDQSDVPVVLGKDIWETYQYVGPIEDDSVTFNHLTNTNYWKKIN